MSKFGRRDTPGREKPKPQPQQALRWRRWHKALLSVCVVAILPLAYIPASQFGVTIFAALFGWAFQPGYLSWPFWLTYLLSFGSTAAFAALLLYGVWKWTGFSIIPFLGAGALAQRFYYNTLAPAPKILLAEFRNALANPGYFLDWPNLFFGPFLAFIIPLCFSFLLVGAWIVAWRKRRL